MPDTEKYPIKLGGHLVEPTGTTEGTRQERQYRCLWCKVVTHWNSFDVLGALDYCPEEVESMNGYLSVDPSYTGHQRGAQAEKCALQWRDHARRAGYAIEDFRFIDGDPTFCATFRWRGQDYRLRYGRDPEHGITRPGGVNAEKAPEGWERPGA